MWGYREKMGRSVCEPGSPPQTPVFRDLELILNFPVSRLSEINFCCLQTTQSMYSVTAARTYWNTYPGGENKTQINQNIVGASPISTSFCIIAFKSFSHSPCPRYLLCKDYLGQFSLSPFQRWGMKRWGQKAHGQYSVDPGLEPRHLVF